MTAHTARSWPISMSISIGLLEYAVNLDSDTLMGTSNPASSYVRAVRNAR